VSFDADGCEPYSVYNEHQRRARKDHRCSACQAVVIRRGDLYKDIRTVFEGEAETIKRCARCEALYQHLKGLGQRTVTRADGSTYQVTHFVPAEKLDCGNSYQDEWERDPPPEIAALAFWLPGEPLPGAS
jgi:hypothetical protein